MFQKESTIPLFQFWWMRIKAHNYRVCGLTRYQPSLQNQAFFLPVNTSLNSPGKRINPKTSGPTSPDSLILNRCGTVVNIRNIVHCDKFLARHVRVPVKRVKPIVWKVGWTGIHASLLFTSAIWHQTFMKDHQIYLICPVTPLLPNG